MKRLIFIFLCSFAFMLTQAQTQLAKVILKNGTELVGNIISIELSDSLKMNIAGVETDINMAEVAKIESIINDSNGNIEAEVPFEYERILELVKDSKLEIAFSKHLTLVYGDLSTFKDKEKSFQVNLDLSYLSIEGEPVEQYAMHREGGWRNVFTKEIETAVDAFIAKWNSKMHGVRARKNNADMTLNLFITQMDLGSNAAGIWGVRTIDGGASMSGYLELVDNKTNEVLSVVRIDEIKGLGNNGFVFYKEGNRVKKVFEKLAIKMAEDIK